MKRKMLTLGFFFFMMHKMFAANIAWDMAFIYDYDDPPIHVLDCFADNYDAGGHDSAGFAIRLYYTPYDYYAGFDGIWRHYTGIVVEPDSGGGLAYAMNIDEMNVGDTVSEESVRGNQSYFYANWIDAEPGYDGGSPETSRVAIPTGEEVYLGFVTQNAVDQYYYGWFSLIFDGTDVRIGQSAMDLSGGPIVIQPRPTPEPSAATLLALGVAMLLAGRKCAIIEASREKEPVTCQR